MPERDPTKCSHHEGLEKGITEIKADTKTIIEKMEAGGITFAQHGLRIGILEKIVYGAVGLLLLAAVGVTVKLIFGG